MGSIAMHNIPSAIQDFSLLIVWVSVLVNATGLPILDGIWQVCALADVFLHFFVKFRFRRTPVYGKARICLRE